MYPGIVKHDIIFHLYNNQPYIDTEVILHQLQPMNNQSGNDEIMIKVEVDVIRAKPTMQKEGVELK